jgi:hypothetical protein
MSNSTDVVEVHFSLSAKWIAIACVRLNRELVSTIAAVETLGAKEDAATVATCIAMAAVLERALAEAGLSEEGRTQVYRHGRNIASVVPVATSAVPAAKA